MPPAPTRVDATGTFCPLPLLLAARRLAGLPAGALLELLGDDPALPADLRAWCASTGHELLSLEEESGTFRCLLRKAAADP